ncbi:MAG: sialate O-acetylesterase, partial [Candidatus Sulfotelmatobacter sp.]
MRLFRAQVLTTLFVLTLLAAVATAEATLPSLLADHMVIQRGLPVHVWGMAAPQEAVTVIFRGETKSTNADELGRWSLYLSVGEAGGPFSMVVKAANTITLSDVMVGDVWVASGQSNMEFPMTGLKTSDAEIAAAKHPEIRFFMVDHRPADYPGPDVPGKAWTLCTPESVAKTSAVAYYFAREVAARQHVTVGLIESFWGGTTAESWTSLRALSADASLMPVFAARNTMVESQAATLLQREQEDREYQKAVAQAQAEGKPAPWPQWHPDFAGWAPSALYNGMIAPLTPFAIRGVIWYQGESNAGPERAPIYAHLFQTMIRDWRRSWDEGDFPFLFVQLANWKTGPGARWPEVRDAQRQTLALKNTGMAVIIDVGNPDDLHPKDKLDVGLRLSLAARAIAYGEKIEWSGPLYKQLTSEEHALRVWFDHAEGLTARGGEVTGFEVVGADGKYSPAQAKIEGISVVVSSAAVPTPVSVRYAWADSPTCNLYN